MIVWASTMQQFCVRTAKLMQMMPKHFSDTLSTILAYTRTKVVLRRVGRRGHFRSRDKDGGYTNSIRHCRKPLAIYANLTVLSSIESEILSIEVLHCGNR